MKVKTLTIAAVLSVLPAISFAMCSYDKQAMSCAEGTVFDEASSSCVAATT
jgi:hypothetical protein